MQTKLKTKNLKSLFKTRGNIKDLSAMVGRVFVIELVTRTNKILT